MHDLKKIFRSSHIALKGLRHAYVSDKSFRMEINYGLPVYAILGWYLYPFYAWEFLLFIFSYFFILMTELVNTAFEKMLDRVHPEEHDLIGKSKDIAAAAVLLTFVFAAIVVGVLLATRLTYGVSVVIPQFFV
jgi:diacylglycerol kinase